MKDDSILIVGSIAIDTIEIGTERYEKLLGGSTTYATIAAGKYSDVNVVGIIGNDLHSHLILFCPRDCTEKEGSICCNRGVLLHSKEKVLGNCPFFDIPEHTARSY